MEIQKVIIRKELVGFYFYFSTIKKINYNNMSYAIENTEANDETNYLAKIKKYQCNFILEGGESYLLNTSKYESKKSSFFNSLIIKPSEKKENDKKEIKNLLKKRKKSVEKKSIVLFNPVEDNNPINNCLFTNKYYSNDDGEAITDKFIPKYSSHFSIDLNNLSFVQIFSNDEQIEYLKILKNEANEKIGEVVAISSSSGQV